MWPNYAFKRTAEQALRPKQTVVPQPLNAALAFKWSDMETGKEKRYLRALMAYEHDSERSPGQIKIILISVWVSLVIVLLFVFQTIGYPSTRELGWIAGSVVLGVLIAVYAFLRVQREQWKILRKYVNFREAQERLAEIDRESN